MLFFPFPCEHVYYPSIHPFSRTTGSGTQGCRSLLEPSPAVIGQRWVDTLRTVIGLSVQLRWTKTAWCWNFFKMDLGDFKSCAGSNHCCSLPLLQKGKLQRLFCLEQPPESWIRRDLRYSFLCHRNLQTGEKDVLAQPNSKWAAFKSLSVQYATSLSLRPRGLRSNCCTGLIFPVLLIESLMIHVI